MIFSPVTLFSAFWFKYIRTGNIRQMPLSEKIFMKVGVLPIKDHYYQPLVNPAKDVTKPLDEPRTLPGIEWNIEEQLRLLEKFDLVDELKSIPY